MDNDWTVDLDSRITTEFGDAYLNKDGYYVIRHSSQIYTSLHRKIYEKYNGDIPRNWEVHHKDCDKTNNSPENLIALSKSQHRLLHEQLRRNKRAHKKSKVI